MICCKGENGSTIRTPFENLQKSAKIAVFCKVCIILAWHATKTPLFLMICCKGEDGSTVRTPFENL